ncbi:MAG: Ig-like domain-containing protein, partial [bacterium]|nr:Ig-like domain-containing protein [bacterium]
MLGSATCRDRIATTVLVFALLAFTACSRDQEPAPEPPTGEIAQAGPEAPPPSLSPEELAPVIREVAEADVGPSKIVIELAKPVIEKGKVGEGAGDGTVLEVEPQVDGELKFTSPSTLTFEPSEGFAPGTTYTVELTSLETPAGVLTAPAAGRWVRVFTTPAFDFARFSLASVDYARKKAEAHLVFSGPVTAREVEKRAHLVVSDPQSGDRRRPSVRFRPGPQRHMVLAQLSGSMIRGGGRLELALDEGTPSAIDPKQRAVRRTASIDLAMGPVAKIVDTYRAEGSSGFYVQVICDDSAGGDRRYYWDRVNHEYYQVSSRCQLDEADAAFGIHFEPQVDYSVTPSGGGFRIFGDFERGSYHMRIEAGVKTADGGMLHQAYETDFTVPAR